MTPLDRRTRSALNLPKTDGAVDCTDLSSPGHDARRRRIELETFALIADIVAGVAFVISLVALTSEIRQNNRALARQARQQSFGQFSNARTSLYTDAQARALLDKAHLDPDFAAAVDRAIGDHLTG